MLLNLRTCLVFAVVLVLSVVVVNVVISEVAGLAVDSESPRKIVLKVDFVIVCCRTTRESL
jgi:hypothetical protein